jgi:hypothetical protein
MRILPNVAKVHGTVSIDPLSMTDAICLAYATPAIPHSASYWPGGRAPAGNLRAVHEVGKQTREMCHAS